MIDLLAHASLAALTLVAWFGAGSLVLARLRVEDELLDVLNRLLAGSLAFALALFATGWSDALDATAYRVALVLAGAVGVVALARLRHRPRLGLARWRSWELALAALLALYVVLGTVAASAPVTSPDALLYHSADPALFEREGRIVEVPWNSSSYEPFTVEMLVLGGTLLWNPEQGAFAPLLLALVALAAVMGMAHRLAGRAAALLAGSLFFAQPFMAWEATSVFVEPGLAAAVGLATWNVSRFLVHSERNGLILAGAFAGGAAGTKYLGLIVALALVVGGLVALRRRPRGRELAWFAVPATLVALPWYVKNAVLTGNPFYPHLFGGLNASASAELERSMREDFGHGREPLDAALLPARLLLDGEAFDGGQFITPLFVAFVPLVALLSRERRPPAAVWAGIAVFALGWFATTQQARFLVPLMPVLAVLGALGALALAARGRRGRLAVAGATAAALAFGLAATSVYTAQFVPVVAGSETEEEFLRGKVSLYDGVEWLNRNLESDDKVVVDGWSLLYLDVPYTTFGTMGDLLPPEAGEEESRAFVETNAITHAAILETNTARRLQIESLGHRLVAEVPVRSVRSRTRRELGPRRLLLVYALDDG